MNNDIELPKLNNEKKSNIAFLKDVYKYITTRKADELLSLLWRLFLIALFVIVLYVPFQLFRDLGINILLTMGISFNETILNIWTGLWSVLYGIIAIILFFKLCKDRYYKLVNIEKETKEENSIENIENK